MTESTSAGALRTVVRIVVSLPGWALIGLFRVWQLLVSPTYGQTCRFYPSCSAYGVEAVRNHGALRGLVLTGWRILRCNPWNSGGVDLVPPRGGALFRRPDDAESDLSRHVHDESEGDTRPLVDDACPDEPAPSRRRAA